jgi:hypothetical protein
VAVLAAELTRVMVMLAETVALAVVVVLRVVQRVLAQQIRDTVVVQGRVQIVVVVAVLVLLVLVAVRRQLAETVFRQA